MRPTIYLFMTALAALLPVAGFAEDRHECLLRCSAEQDFRDSACQPADAPRTPSDEQAQCETRSMALYTVCFRDCPPLQMQPAASDVQQTSPQPQGN